MSCILHLISTHAPRTGGDMGRGFLWERFLVFQPTPPAQGATVCGSRKTPDRPDFNPRPPHRGRPPVPAGPHLPVCHFNPRPPHRGRHGVIFAVDEIHSISTHAPRTGGDWGTVTKDYWGKYFNPRPPHRGRPRPHPAWAYPQRNFNPRPPHRGRLGDGHKGLLGEIFQPTPPAQGATASTSSMGLSSA